MAKSDPIALSADPSDPEDFDVSEAGLAGALAERTVRRGRMGRPPGSEQITGYRDLTQEQVDAMNAVKAVEAKLNGLIDFLRIVPGVDQRQVAIAATAGEEAFMRAVRAIAQPSRIVEPFTPTAA